MRINPIIALPVLAGTVGTVLLWAKLDRRNHLPPTSFPSPFAHHDSRGDAGSAAPDIVFDRNAKRVVNGLKKEEDLAGTGSRVSTPPPNSPALEKAMASGFIAKPRDILRAHPQYQTNLERRAKEVEREANLELEKLVELLDLTEAQQNRIFGILVSNSAAFDPIMQIENGDGIAATGSSAASLEGLDITSTPSTEDQIHGVLDPDQRDIYVQDEIDRMEFWDVAIADLEQLITEDDFPQVASPPPPDPGPADDWRGYEIASDGEGDGENETEEDETSSSKKKKNP